MSVILQFLLISIYCCNCNRNVCISALKHSFSLFWILIWSCLYYTESSTLCFKLYVPELWVLLFSQECEYSPNVASQNSANTFTVPCGLNLRNSKDWCLILQIGNVYLLHTPRVSFIQKKDVVSDLLTMKCFMKLLLKLPADSNKICYSLASTMCSDIFSVWNSSPDILNLFEFCPWTHYFVLLEVSSTARFVDYDSSSSSTITKMNGYSTMELR